MALEVNRVESVRRAAEILAADTGARFIGGATLAVRNASGGDLAIHRLLLPEGLGLDQIAIDSNRVEVGAAVTMAQVAAEPALSFLHPVAHSIGGPAVRNMATVGGNLFAPYPYGDFAVALLALDAEVVSEDANGKNATNLERFLLDGERMKPMVVRSVVFALPPTGAFRFAKVVRRKPHGASVLSIAAVLPMAGRKVSGARVAYGAMAPTAIRAPAVEDALEGKPLDEKTIAAAIAVAAEGCAPLSDPQASEWYRRAVLPVHLKRLLAG